MAAITFSTEKKSVTEYLGTLVWDGTPRIDRWLVDCACAEDSPYVRAASRVLLVAAVRRARHPGCWFDQLPILDGPQGCGKSAALRLLAVEDDWFTNTLQLDGDTRQIIESTAGKWIVEASELQRLFQADNDDDEEDADEEDVDAEDDEDEEEDEDAGDEGGGGEDEDEDEDEDDAGEAADLPPAAAFKSFLSRSVDEARMAYQIERTRVLRSFVVVGTTAMPYLKDTTGHRRIWPIRVGHFDLGCLSEARDQLWAEAAVAEATGESIHLDAVASNA
jgi:predicted P-loop ATPase